MRNSILKTENCTGCGLCMNICPSQAINMKVDNEGFLFPSIDFEKCTNCGLCRRKCPAISPSFINNDKATCFVAYADDTLREKSSSGGVFPLFAEWFLNNNGYVCGASWTENNLVEHIIINDKNDLYKLQGSKYLQSNTKNVYQDIKKILNQNQFVLFSGTPCQVAGLNSFLGKSYSNLLTIEIVCHGTPSPKVYKKYIDELIKDKNEKVLYTNFRDKVKGWNPYYITTITDKNIYSFPAFDDTYMNAFLNDLSLRKSCGNCLFARLPRQADITIGDFWGINKLNSKYDDKKGTSLILINNLNGSNYLNMIKDKFKLLEETPIKYALDGNPVLTRSSKIHKKRKYFFSSLDRCNLKENLDISLGKKYDLGILNLWYSNNYGAILTCYSLQEALKKLGYNPKVINYIPPRYIDKFKNNLSDKFSSNYLDLTKLYQSKNELKLLNEQTDTFIVGSDQVWRHKYFWGQGQTIFLLDFARHDKKKISYAASFGVDYFEGNYEDTQKTKFYMQRFDDISVREQDGVNICKDVFNTRATHVLDPVFLLETKEWEKLINSADCNNDNFIASYVLDKSTHAQKVVDFAIKKFDAFDCINISDAQKGNSNESVENWLYYIKNCKFFITDSFHGVCFAIIFNKPFICLANMKRGYSRFKSLFDLFALHSKCVTENDNIDDRYDLFDDIDYNKINKILCEEKIKSLNWLSSALKKDKLESNHINDTIETLLIKIDELTDEINSLKYGSKYFSSSKITLYRYKILSKILFGKKRKKYKQKYKELKKLLKCKK